MATSSISNDELLALVEEDRLREQKLRNPYLLAFRATPEEIELRQVEAAQDAATGETGFARWAEELARSGRESVRFERYLIRQGFYPKIPANDPKGVQPA